MNTKLLASMLLGTAVLVGCESNRKSGMGGACCCMPAKATEVDDAKTVEITRDQVPAKVLASFEKAFPGVTIAEIKQETYADGTVHYEFEYKDKTGKELEVELNAEGEVLEDHE